jgi:hypothetical protein
MQKNFCIGLPGIYEFVAVERKALALWIDVSVPRRIGSVCRRQPSIPHACI